MRLISWIQSALRGGRRRAPGCLVVDAEKLAESREGRVGPAERFRAIQYLSRIADREKMEITAVVAGRPLREVANGERYNGVRVYYVDENKTLADTIDRLARKLGATVCVVTNDRTLESRLRDCGVETLRIATLRKAFEGVDALSEPGRGRGADRRGKAKGREEEKAGEDAGNSTEDSAANDDAATEARRSNQKPLDTVDGLIDRV